MGCEAIQGRTIRLEYRVNSAVVLRNARYGEYVRNKYDLTPSNNRDTSVEGSVNQSELPSPALLTRSVFLPSVAFEPDVSRLKKNYTSWLSALL